MKIRNLSENLMTSPPSFPSGKHLVIITGPTAVGKTSLTIQLAQHFHSEIISADSRQFYKELIIGTAAPTPEELKTIKHHLVGMLSITENYNVYRFEKDVISILEKLFIKNDIVFMVGGSGLYIDAVCNGIDEIPDPDMELRNKLNTTYETLGIQPLRQQLMLLDPESYEKLDIANHKRIIRALEVCIATGKPYSSFLNKKSISRPFNIIKIGLKRERAELYASINKRVDIMIQCGLENEARSLYPFRDLNSLQTVGYRELFDYFDGTYSLTEAIEKIKTNTRRYAKKQMTWFERDEKINWFHPSETEKILAHIKKHTTPTL